MMRSIFHFLCIGAFAALSTAMVWPAHARDLMNGEDGQTLIARFHHTTPAGVVECVSGFLEAPGTGP